MGRHKKKSADTVAKSFEELVDQVTMAFGSRYDDRELEMTNHASLRDVAEEFGITMLKARKILITADMYSTQTGRKIQILYSKGKKITEIMELIGLSRASVHSYIPYSKVVYKLKERSVCADRMKHSRDRQKLCDKLNEQLPSMDVSEADSALWEVIAAHEGCIFYTEKGFRFRYKIKGDEMFIDRKKDSITKSTVFMAFHKAMDFGEIVSGPKKLGIFGSSYLYAIFVRIGIIKDR